MLRLKNVGSLLAELKKNPQHKSKGKNSWQAYSQKNPQNRAFARPKAHEISRQTGEDHWKQAGSYDYPQFAQTGLTLRCSGHEFRGLKEFQWPPR